MIKVSVMYAGEVVESAPAADLFAAPRHPYTQGLLACVPIPGKIKRGDKLGSIPGTVPRIADGFTGCGFRDRCAQAMPQCADSVPQRDDGAGHRHLCHLA